LDSIYCDNYKSLIWGGKYDWSWRFVHTKSRSE
jgi:hypothetical protein